MAAEIRWRAAEISGANGSRSIVPFAAGGPAEYPTAGSSPTFSITHLGPDFVVRSGRVRGTVGNASRRSCGTTDSILSVTSHQRWHLRLPRSAHPQRFEPIDWLRYPELLWSSKTFPQRISRNSFLSKYNAVFARRHRSSPDYTDYLDLLVAAAMLRDSRVAVLSQEVVVLQRVRPHPEEVTNVSRECAPRAAPCLFEDGRTTAL